VKNTNKKVKKAVSESSLAAAGSSPVSVVRGSVLSAHKSVSERNSLGAPVASTASGDGGLGVVEPVSSQGRRGGKKLSPAASSQATAGDPAVVISPLLSEVLLYVSYHRNRSTTDALKRVMLAHFTPDEINNAKKLLVGAYRTELEGCSAVTERRASASRSIREAEVDDIVEIFQFLDTSDLLDRKRIVFAAVHWDRIPKYGPEDCNPCSLADRQLQIEATVAKLASSVEQGLSGVVAADVAKPDGIGELKSAVTDVEKKLMALSQNVTSKISQLTVVCQQLASTVTSRNPSPAMSSSAPSYAQPPSPVSPLVDRSKNVVVFGIAESPDSFEWRNQLAKALRHAAGHDVPVTDVLRLGGRLAADRARPVLVKFQTGWDRRLVLSGARNLADIPELKRVFIKADETVDERRKGTLKRLQAKAVKEGKVMKLSDDDGGSLFVDGALIFSLNGGFVKSAAISNGSTN
jgi:hypothetical protein